MLTPCLNLLAVHSKEFSEKILSARRPAPTALFWRFGGKRSGARTGLLLMSHSWSTWSCLELLADYSFPFRNVIKNQTINFHSTSTFARKFAVWAGWWWVTFFPHLLVNFGRKLLFSCTIEYLPSHITITFDNLFIGVDSISVSICVDKYSLRSQDPNTSSDNKPRCLVQKIVPNYSALTNTTIERKHQKRPEQDNQLIAFQNCRCPHWNGWLLVWIKCNGIHTRWDENRMLSQNDMKYRWTWKRRQIEKYALLTTSIIIISSSAISIQSLCKHLLNCSYYGVCEHCKSTIVLTSLLSKVGSGDDSVSEQMPNIKLIDIFFR